MCSWCPLMGLKQAEFLSRAAGTPLGLASCSDTTFEVLGSNGLCAQVRRCCSDIAVVSGSPPETWRVPGPQLGFTKRAHSGSLGWEEEVSVGSDLSLPTTPLQHRKEAALGPGPEEFGFRS